MNTLQIHKAIIEDMIQEDLDNQRFTFMEAIKAMFLAIRPGEEKDFPCFYTNGDGELAWYHNSHWAMIPSELGENQTATNIDILDETIIGLVDKYQTIKGIYLYIDKGNYLLVFDDQEDYFQHELDTMYEATTTDKLFIAYD